MLLTPIFNMNIDAKYIIQYAEHFDKGRILLVGECIRQNRMLYLREFSQSTRQVL